MGGGVGRLEGMLDAGADVVSQAGPERVEEADEYRQLEDQGKKRGERVDLVLPIELHDLLLLALLVVLVLRLDRFQLGRHPLELLHRVELLEGQRQQQRPDHNRQRDDRPTPRPADHAVEEDQDRTEDVDQRLENVG